MSIGASEDTANSRTDWRPACEQRVIPAAKLHEVLREQFEYLLAHSREISASMGYCSCPLCVRFERIRQDLLAMFRD